MIDTPGFGKQNDFEIWYCKIMKFILDSAIEYKQAKLRETEAKDTRIHLCLFFIKGPRCENRNLEVMRRLQRYVRIIPILAKADSYTSIGQIQDIKRHILDEICNHDIELFDCGRAMGEDINLIDKAVLKPLPPFAIISDLSLIETESNRIKYGRKYQWGVCDISDPSISDFGILSKLLMGHFVLAAINESKLLNKKTLQMVKQIKHTHLKNKKKQRQKQKNQIITAVISSLAVSGLCFFGKKS